MATLKMGNLLNESKFNELKRTFKKSTKKSLRFQKFDLTIAIQVEKADCVVMIIFFENVRSSVY